MALDITPFRRAVALLSAALAEARAEPGRDFLRDGATQRFEYTYELRACLTTGAGLRCVGTCRMTGEQ